MTGRYSVEMLPVVGLRVLSAMSVVICDTAIFIPYNDCR